MGYPTRYVANNKDSSGSLADAEVIPSRPVENSLYWVINGGTAEYDAHCRSELVVNGRNCQVCCQLTGLARITWPEIVQKNRDFYAAVIIYPSRCKE